MIARVVINEFAKMHRLWMGPLVAGMAVTVIGLSILGAIADPEFAVARANPAEHPWEHVSTSLSSAVPLVTPVMLGILASRQVEIEHQGNGWLPSHTAGVPAGRLCRAKFLAVGSLVTVATILQIGMTAALGGIAGISVPFPTGSWAQYTISIVVINLSILAVHLLLAAKVSNQLVGLGVGVFGTFVAMTATLMPPVLAHFFPWGYYALAQNAEYRNHELVPVSPSSWRVALLAVAATTLFWIATARFNRQEA